MARERSNPVARVTPANHGLPILARAQQKRALWCGCAECEVDHGALVAAALQSLTCHAECGRERQRRKEKIVIVVQSDYFWNDFKECTEFSNFQNAQATLPDKSHTTMVAQQCIHPHSRQSHLWRIKEDMIADVCVCIIRRRTKRIHKIIYYPTHLLLLRKIIYIYAEDCDARPITALLIIMRWPTDSTPICCTDIAVLSFSNSAPLTPCNIRIDVKCHY